MTLALAIEALRAGLGGLIVVAGLVFMAGGTIGVLRFPDYYTRLHAVSAADYVGGAIIIAGLAVSAPSAGLAVKLALLALLLAVMSPVLTQLAANAAHSGGLAPMSGAYVAPRPALGARGADA